MSLDIILREASTVLRAANRYASELSEAGITDGDLHQMRVLITRVAAHSYTTLGSQSNVSAELHELLTVKDSILRTAEEKFGSNLAVIGEFRYTVRKPTGK